MADASPIRFHPRVSINGISTTDESLGFVHSLVDMIETADEIGIGLCVELVNCWMAGPFPATATSRWSG